ncbi:MAG: methylated-DNA--[protein]-cysteine S-methyltransferase [Mucinivorans sp.]
MEQVFEIVTSAPSFDGVIDYWSQQSDFGPLVLATTDRGVCYLGFGDSVDDLRSRFAKATFRSVDRSVCLTSIRCLHLMGTPFQLSVWLALLATIGGQRVTYTDIARLVGREKSVRAVANAVGANPISILVPCHRVVRADGSLGGYHWGTDFKARLLASELLGLPL